MTPYSNLPPRCFWKTGVLRSDPLTVDGLYRAKFAIKETDKIATAGSCFAQNLVLPLKLHGYRVLDMEPPPPWLGEAERRKHGYELFSARYGNIYTARQLLQLAREVFEGFSPAEPVWSLNGRFVDAQRPGVDPLGADTAEEVLALRAAHLAAVRRMFEQMNVFVFTLGLTETWMDSAGTTVFPTAPGTVAGTWAPERYRLHNFSYQEVVDDLRAFRSLIQQYNRHFRMILTVSPVPLAATAQEAHVLVATTGSKATLRAAADGFAATDDSVDYFPSYELIATALSGGIFYEANQRDITPEGVAAVMRVFFDQHAPLEVPGEEASAGPDTQCEEQLLEAFGT